MELYSLTFVPDHFKKEQMCLGAVHKIPYTLRYVSDRYETARVCEKIIEREPGALMFSIG